MPDNTIAVRGSREVANRSILLEDARVIFRNFTGEERLYNAEGNRNFTLVLPEDVGQAMLLDGWNVKRLKPRGPDEEGDLSLKVKVSFKGRSKPKASLVTLSRNARTPLDEDMFDMLDYADAGKIDVIIRPYDWDVNGKQGRTAYLSNIVMVLNEDELELKYSHLAIENGVGAVEETFPSMQPELPRGFDYDGEVVEDSGWEIDRTKALMR
jgi:hypothetical protein